MTDAVTYPWGEMEWLASAELGNATSVSVARMRVRPGGVAERHRHPDCDEVVSVQAGTLDLELDGVRTAHAVGDCLVIPSGCAHQVRNASKDDLLLLLTYGSGQRMYEPC